MELRILMPRKTKRKLHLLETAGGLKNTEEYFAKMAEKGWRLEKMGVMLCRYRAAEPCNARFFVDIMPHMGVFDYPHGTEAQRYRKQFEEQGWSYVTSQKMLHVFRAEDGQAPPPDVHSNNSEQNRVYMNFFLKHELFPMLIELIALIPFVFSLLNTGAELFLSDFTTFLALGSPIIIAVFIWLFLSGASWFIRAKLAAKRGTPLPVTSRLVWRLQRSLLSAGLLLFIVFTAAGFILTAVRGEMPLSFFVMALALPAVGVTAGLLFRRRVETRYVTRDTNISNFVVLIIAVSVFGAVVGGAAAFSGGRFSSRPLDETLNGPALTLLSVGVTDNPYAWFMPRGESLAVPVNYTYQETAGHKSVFTQFRQAANGRIARRLYNHAVRTTYDQYTSRRECPDLGEARFAFTSRHMDSAEAALWFADEGFIIDFDNVNTGKVMIFLNDRTMIRVSISGMEIDTETLRQAVRGLFIHPFPNTTSTSPLPG